MKGLILTVCLVGIVVLSFCLGADWASYAPNHEACIAAGGEHYRTIDGKRQCFRWKREIVEVGR